MIITLFCLATTPWLDLPISQRYDHVSPKTYTVQVDKGLNGFDRLGYRSNSVEFVYKGQSYTVAYDWCVVKEETRK